jgi:hypothetical protein
MDLGTGNITGIEQVELRAATYSCTAAGVYPVFGECSSYYLCKRRPSGTLRLFKRTCFPNNYNPVTKTCSSSFVCPQPYACNELGFLCYTSISYAQCNTVNTIPLFGLCPPGFFCNSRCNVPCTFHVLTC